jgi:hypothetical protein
MRSWFVDNGPRFSHPEPVEGVPTSCHPLFYATAEETTMLTAQAPAPPAVATLDVGTTHWLIILTAATIIATGVVVIVGRWWMGQRDSSASIVRGWLGVSLVAGLLLFCGASLAAGDSNMRSTLFGGLIASAGAATVFHFASKGSDQARQDILNASFGTIQVPDLEKKTVGGAHLLMARTALELRLDPPDGGDGDIVAKQTPPAGTSARKGSAVVATATPPDGQPHPGVSA